MFAVKTRRLHRETTGQEKRRLHAMDIFFCPKKGTYGDRKKHGQMGVWLAGVSSGRHGPDQYSASSFARATGHMQPGCRHSFYSGAVGGGFALGPEPHSE